MENWIANARAWLSSSVLLGVSHLLKPEDSIQLPLLPGDKWFLSRLLGTREISKMSMNPTHILFGFKIKAVFLNLLEKKRMFSRSEYFSAKVIMLIILNKNLSIIKL